MHTTTSLRTGGRWEGEINEKYGNASMKSQVTVTITMRYVTERPREQSCFIQDHREENAPFSRGVYSLQAAAFLFFIFADLTYEETRGSRLFEPQVSLKSPRCRLKLSRSHALNRILLRNKIRQLLTNGCVRKIARTFLFLRLLRKCK